MRKRVLASVILLSVCAVALWLFVRQRQTGVTYRFADISRGNVQTKVNATGKLEAVGTVQVGTQVSGQIAAIHADFNDRVHKGQVIARIDSTLAEQAVSEAQANLSRARAESVLRQYSFDQSKALYEQRVITESEFRNSEFNLASAQSTLHTAQAALERAQRNMDYTVIRAPIDGIVVERNVDVGQTVAASLSAPQLFLIAQDLTHMQIVAAIDESDIGHIREGAPATFTVQAYPNEIFPGRVRQVRLQSKTTENVVTYSVVVRVANPDGKLLPGMTATLDVLLDSANMVLRAPNAALRFRPSEELQAQARARAAPPSLGVAPNDTQQRVALRRRPTRGDSVAAAAISGELWYIDMTGALAVAAVHRGLSDGQYTEVAGPLIREGMKVIVGQSGSVATATANPFQQTPRGNGSPPGPPNGVMK